MPLPRAVLMNSEPTHGLIPTRSVRGKEGIGNPTSALRGLEGGGSTLKYPLDAFHISYTLAKIHRP
jgi:hypothetical protein